MQSSTLIGSDCGLEVLPGERVADEVLDGGSVLGFGEQIGDSTESPGRCFPGYHEPEVGQSGRWKGKVWRDMPGMGLTERKLNFALFRRGLYDPEFESESGMKRTWARIRPEGGRRKEAAQ